MNPLLRRFLSVIGIVTLLFGSFSWASHARPALAADTPDPASVTLVGSLQSAIGCGGDWDPACAASGRAYDASDGAWQGSWTVPAGNW